VPGACVSYSSTGCSVGTTYLGPYVSTYVSPCLPCTSCAGNQYFSSACTLTTDAVCTACPTIPNCIYYTCTSPSDVSCTQCAAGYGVSGASCTPCLAGSDPTWNDGTLTGACVGWYETNCPAMFFKGPYVSASVNPCQPCTPVANCAQQYCTTYNFEGLVTCTLCNAGYFVANGNCYNCINSCVYMQYLQSPCTTTSQAVCAACSTVNVANCGTYSCTSATNTACSQCNPGYYLANPLSCQACAPYNVPNCLYYTCTNGLSTTTTCYECASGYYATGPRTCTVCTFNTALYPNCLGFACNPTTGATSCTSCKANFSGPTCSTYTPPHTTGGRTTGQQV